MGKLAKRIISYTVCAFTLLVLTCVPAMSFVVLSRVKAEVAITIQPDFIFTDNEDSSLSTYSYKCYFVDKSHDEISICWGKKPEDTPETLNVSALTFAYTDEDSVEHECTVTGIMKTGFRYCDFKSIVLPDTITEIGEEAFAYCANMTSFTLPYQVKEIAPSTFLDCRSLKYVLFRDNENNPSPCSENLERIGDHAFDSCVSLISFNCADSLKLSYFGQGCFQNCDTFTRFYFPSKNVVDGKINYVTVESYALADCDGLKWIYFEENLHDVKQFAFADCNSGLKLHYGYEGATRADPEYSTKWRNKYLTTKYHDSEDVTNVNNVIEIESNHAIVVFGSYDGLQISIVTDDIYLDCQRMSNSVPNQTRVKLSDGVENGKGHALITEWTPPESYIPGYYDPETKILEIPSSVVVNKVEYPIKIVPTGVFNNKADYIYGLKFNNNLVQIQKEAFYGDNKIKSIDFSSCKTLLEISNCIFHDRSNKKYNNEEKMTSIVLPNSLQYLGRYAFFAFYNVSELKLSNSLLVIGGYCFAQMGANVNAPSINIDLPCTLSDSAAINANINEAKNNDYNGQNWAAIGPYSFGATDKDGYTQTNSFQTVIMTECNHEEHTHTTSIAPNAFVRSKNMVKFVASSKLYRVGNEAFKQCDNLKEVRLTTANAIASNKKFPWASNKDDASEYEASIFNQGSINDCVVYLDGKVPGKNGDTTEYLDSYSLNSNSEKLRWNATQGPSNPNLLGEKYDDAGTALGRKVLPTYKSLNFDTDILYWKPKDRNDEETHGFCNEPMYQDDFNSGIVVFIRQNDKYIVSKYYTDADNVSDEIDLTGITHPDLGDISSNIIEIGNEAFSYTGKVNHGRYFILPPNVKTFGDRCFYRNPGTGSSDVTNYGVRIVTYKSGNTIQGSYANNKNPGYCILPSVTSSNTEIKRNAFYNNLFETVSLPATTSFIGKNAFYTQPSTTASQTIGGIGKQVIPNANNRTKLSSITIGTNSLFEIANEGLYYKVAANKTLLYQFQNTSSTDLTIAANTKAIGAGACANTHYTSINLNNTVTHIYGGGFQNNYNLTTISGESKLEYISAIAPNKEVWNSNLPFDIWDFKDYLWDKREEYGSNGSAFQGCINLKTFNFTTLTSLKKIGRSAFRNCMNLDNMTGGSTTYNYYVYDNGVPANPTYTNTKGVLDLSKCSSLVCIAKYAFAGCEKIEFVHLPNRNGQMFVGKDNDASFDAADYAFYSNTTKYLVGDKATNGYYGKNSNHYPDGWYGKKGDKELAYYYAENDNDLLTDVTDSSLIRYWTKDNDGKFILFNGYSDALAYLPSGE